MPGQFILAIYLLTRPPISNNCNVVHWPVRNGVDRQKIHKIRFYTSWRKSVGVSGDQVCPLNPKIFAGFTGHYRTFSLLKKRPRYRDSGVSCKIIDLINTYLDKLSQPLNLNEIILGLTNTRVPVSIFITDHHVIRFSN